MISSVVSGMSLPKLKSIALSYGTANPSHLLPRSLVQCVLLCLSFSFLQGFPRLENAMSTSSDTLMAGPSKNLSRAASRTSVPMPINMDICKRLQTWIRSGVMGKRMKMRMKKVMRMAMTMRNLKGIMPCTVKVAWMERWNDFYCHLYHEFLPLKL